MSGGLRGKSDLGKSALSPPGPVKEHLSIVDEPSPQQLAGVLCAVAGTAERQNWTVEHASEVLDMLGMGPVEISMARRALRASLVAQQAVARVPTALPVLRAVESRSEAEFDSNAPPASTRDAEGHFIRTGMCQKLLHPLTGDNVVRRPDRAVQQCRACTRARRRKDRERKSAEKARVKK